MTVSKPLDKTKQRPPAGGHPWRQKSFDQMQKRKAANEQRKPK